MKNIIISILLAAGLSLAAFGQGRIAFNNIFTDPLTSTPGTSPVTISTAAGTFNPADGPPGAYVGSNYTASLFWLAGTVTEQAVFDSLNPMWAIDVSFFGTTGTSITPGPSVDGSGFFDGGVVRLPQVGYVTLQVRTWYNGGGIYASYEAAKAAGQNVGLANLLSLAITASPGPPRNLDGLQPFIVGIPEPSTFVLVGLGGAVVLLCGRRK